MNVYIVIDDVGSIKAVFGKRDSAQEYINQLEAEFNGNDLIQLGYISKLNWVIEEHKFHPPAIRKEIVRVWEARLTRKGRMTVVNDHWLCVEDVSHLNPHKWVKVAPLDISFYSVVSEEDAIAQAERYKVKGEQG
jgi:hypothetical protein